MREGGKAGEASDSHKHCESYVERGKGYSDSKTDGWGMSGERKAVRREKTRTVRTTSKDRHVVLKDAQRNKKNIACQRKARKMTWN